VKMPLAPLLLSALMIPSSVLLGETSSATACSVHAASYQGWDAQELDNSWLKLTFVPKLGGRLMQVEFNGHPYFFVNSKYRGQYISPDEAKGDWINYGGDKIWPMPEGNSDEHHWALASTAIDDLPYESKVLSQGEKCTVELTGQPDTITGLQYVRTISVSANSPEIHFHAVMRNATAHTIEWSMQSVSQYDLGDPDKPDDYNHQFFAYTPTNPSSTYPDGYHVRSGLADDRSFSLNDGLFRLHWTYFSNEVWLDSPVGWIAVVDQQSRYGMIERFHFDPAGNYPGKATVIFYRNGPSVGLDKQGHISIRDATPDKAPYYMEAELNSPIVKLAPDETYAMDTVWNPIRIDAAPLSVTESGVVTRRLSAVANADSVVLTGSFAPFTAGSLVAVFMSNHGGEAARRVLRQVRPEESVVLNESVPMPSNAGRILLKLYDASGADLGMLDQVKIETQAQSAGSSTK
jgi:hypothetical protein